MTVVVLGKTKLNTIVHVLQEQFAKNFLCVFYTTFDSTMSKKLFNWLISEFTSNDT